jgi:hypothetical protein
MNLHCHQLMLFQNVPKQIQLFTLILFCFESINAMPTQPTLPLYDISRSYSSSLHENQKVSIRESQFPAGLNLKLDGYVCQDYVEIGGIRSKLSFACWTNPLSVELWNVMGNGILGLGPSISPYKNEASGYVFPPPLLQSLSNSQEDDNSIPKKFALLASSSSAELQLGGIVASSIQGDIHYVQSRHSNAFSLRIKSLRIGDTYDTAQELLNFAPHSKQDYIPALIDSMQACIMLPNSVENGDLISSPFEQYQNRDAPWKSMYLTVSGIDEGIEISYDKLLVEHHTFLDEAWGTSVRPCVMPGSAEASHALTPIVLGAIFFRAYAVLFDFSKSTAQIPPVLGFGKINPEYEIIGLSDWRATLEGSDKNPVHRVFVQHNTPKIRHLLKGANLAAGEEVGVYNANGHEFIMQLLVGTPPQPMHVVIDTGSSVTGLFVDQKSIHRFEHGERPHDTGRPMLSACFTVVIVI